jgi:hypothetical protein
MSAFLAFFLEKPDPARRVSPIPQKGRDGVVDAFMQSDLKQSRYIALGLSQHEQAEKT